MKRHLGLATLLALAAPSALAACDDGPPVDDADAGGDGGRVDAGPAVCNVDVEPEAELPTPARHTARWAFEPWISKDISDREDTLAFVQGFHDHDIPVGALVLDSPWDSQYTTFQPNPDRYGDFPDLVETMHEQNVRVVLWTTAFVNKRSFDLETGGDRYIGPAPNYADGKACGFFVQDGETYTWWKGEGASVDFFDARARAWWHAQQDTVLDAGIDGWKLDFGDSYLEADATLSTEAGDVPHQEYAEAYYHDFLAYGVSKRGRDFTTMVRAWDESYDRRGRFHARPEDAPVAWMGDNHRNWDGLVDALDHVFRSAEGGYVVLGSDVGGYLDRDQHMLITQIPFDVENFQRWTATFAMLPFFQLHGRGNLAPWTVPGTDEDREETTAIYRYWSRLHHAMVPYWYSATEEAYATDSVIVHPIGEEADWAGDYRFQIGEAFFVAPMIESGDERSVEFPAEDGVRYYPWFQPAADPEVAGVVLESYDVSDPLRIPLFVREGAIVPMTLGSAEHGLEADDGPAGSLAAWIWPASDEHSFRVREGDDDAITTITAQRTSSAITIGLAPAHASVLLRVRVDAEPTGVTAGGAALTEAASLAALDAAASGWAYDATEKALWVKSTAPVGAIEID